VTVASSTAPAVPAIVIPVVDYEPAIGAAAPAWPAPPVRRPPVRHLEAVPTGPSRRAPSPQLGSAAAFADAALRTVLEVIDRRRPPTQLRALMSSGLADSVLAFGRTAGARRGAAVLRRARVQPCDRDERAFEVAATYSRQHRTHAIACRIEWRGAASDRRWQIVALHIG